MEDYGLMLEPQQGMSVAEIIDWSQYAETLGFGCVFRSDHLLPSRAPKKETDLPECWVTLGALAARTSTIRFGPMVSPVGFRNPALLARMACTLHSFSQGRLLLGMGAGWYEPEYIAHGFDFPSLKIRRKRLEEAIKIVKPIAEGQRVDFDGEHFSAHFECYPKPFGGKIYLIGGGRNLKVAEALGKYFDEWNVFNSPIFSFQSDFYAKLRNALDASSSRGGGKAVKISQMIPFIIGESKSELNSRLQKYMNTMRISGDPESLREKLVAKGLVCGEPEQFIEQLKERRKTLGIERFYFQILDPGEKQMAKLLAETLKKIS